MSTSVDEALLKAHASFEDPRLGVRERFLDLHLGGGRSIGVLSIPTGPPLPVGLVICHSYGTEQLDLNGTEVWVARALAAAGFPTLRFHGQGYGDSEFVGTPVSLRSQLRDALEAVDVLRAATGIRAPGVLGIRYGGLVASLAAERAGLAYLVAVAPVIDGRAFVTELLRYRAMSEMAKRNGSSAASVEQLRRRLEVHGGLEVNGFRLTREMADETSRVNLARDLSGFSGKALLLQVSRGAAPRGALDRLASHLEAVGASVTVTGVQDRFAPLLGYHHFLEVQEDLLGDVLGDLNRKLAEAVTGWMRTQVPAPVSVRR